MLAADGTLGETELPKLTGGATELPTEIPTATAFAGVRAPAGVPDAGNAHGEANCGEGATAIPTAPAFAGVGAPAGVPTAGNAHGEADCVGGATCIPTASTLGGADCGAAETGGDTTPGGLAKDSSS